MKKFLLTFSFVLFLFFFFDKTAFALEPTDVGVDIGGRQYWCMNETWGAGTYTINAFNVNNSVLVPIIADGSPYLLNTENFSYFGDDGFSTSYENRGNMNSIHYWQKFANGNSFNSRGSNGTIYGDCSSNFYQFTSTDAAVAFYRDGDRSGITFDPNPISFDPFDYDFDSSVPTPIVTMDTNFNISFSNGSSDLGLVAYTRWSSIDDIYFYYDVNGGYSPIIDVLSGKWEYRFNSSVLGDLVESISITDHTFSNSSINLFGYYPESPSPFTESFDDFYSAHPFSSRTYDATPIINLISNDYDVFVNKFIGLLKNPRSRLNVPEIYFRFYRIGSDGVPVFGKWTYFSFEKFKPSGTWLTSQDYSYGTDTSSGSSVDDSTPNIIQSTDGVNNDTVTDNSPIDNVVNIRPITNTVNFDYEVPDFTDAINSFRSALGLFANFSAFVNTVFAFLPDWMIVMLGSTVTMLCGLAIYHGIRG